MRVQVTLTGDCNGVYVAEKNATFDSMPRCSGHWEVAARRKGYEDERLAPVTPVGS